MGDFADMAVEAAIDEWMYDLDDPDWDLDDGYRGRRIRRNPTCKYCGETNLIWKKLDGGWRLHEFVHEDDEFLYYDSKLILHTCKFKDAFNGKRR